MRAVFSVLFWTYLALSCVALYFVALAIFAVTVPFDRNRRVQHFFTCLWAYHYVWLNPLWSVRFEGLENLDAVRGPKVIVSNHLSLGDILILFGLFRPFKWVSKQAVFGVPFVGWNMSLAGYVPLVRGAKDSIARMMDASRKWLQRGVPVMLFPEGTRSPDGEMKGFKHGAFSLAAELGVPVVPIVIEGTRDALPKHGLVLSARCRIRVHVLPAVSGDDRDRLLEATRAAMLAEYDRMRAKAAAT